MSIRGLPPVHNRNSRILILGSMPGPLSLKKRQYYAHPQNGFWKIISDLFGATTNYDAGIKKIKSERIALWDIIETCERKGASDSSIKNPSVNDLAAFIKRHQKITRIFFNGKKAESLYRKHFGKRVRIPAKCLPSTSPANAINYREKLHCWKIISNKTSGGERVMS